MSTERYHQQLSFLSPADAEMVELMRFFVREASRLYNVDRARVGGTGSFVNAPRDAYELLRPHMEHLAQEELRVVTLNTRQEVIASPTVYVGNLSAAIVRPAEVYRSAILDAAASIVVGTSMPAARYDGRARLWNRSPWRHTTPLGMPVVPPV